MKRRDTIKELTQLTAQDLQSKARSMAEELMKLRFRKASGQLEQSHRIPELRKNLARVQSFLTSKSAAEKAAK
jgi:large subunit ribosomal protein L29